MTAKPALIRWRKLSDVKLECRLDLERLFETEREAGRFEARWPEFLADDVNREIYRREGRRLVYHSEQLLPRWPSRRKALLLVFGNPAGQSVRGGMFFAYGGRGQDHRFWKHILPPAADLAEAEAHRQAAGRLNRRRRRRLLTLDYASPFKIGLCVMVTLPSAPGGPWGGVQGLQRLLGLKAYRRVLAAERPRVTRLAGAFVDRGGAVVTFQKDAWETLRCERSPAYSIAGAKSHQLIGRLGDAPEIAIYGLPPTRLMGPCRDVLAGVVRKLA